ncbi:hypothetical protein Bca101_066992 [Brassica carinata]
MTINHGDTSFADSQQSESNHSSTNSHDKKQMMTKEVMWRRSHEYSSDSPWDTSYALKNRKKTLILCSGELFNKSKTMHTQNENKESPHEASLVVETKASFICLLDSYVITIDEAPSGQK